LFPIFCHFYLDLIQHGFKDAGKFSIVTFPPTAHIDSGLALRFYKTFSSSLSPSHHAILHHLSTLLLPAHVQNDELAQRFRNEKYAVRMSRSGFGLLVGWLTEGIGGEASGSGDGFSGERGKRGRASVMRVVNNHLRFDGKWHILVYSSRCLLEIQSLHPTQPLSRRMHGRSRRGFFPL
jgi:transcription initiation factor TFIID subunit 5